MFFFEESMKKYLQIIICFLSCLAFFLDSGAAFGQSPYSVRLMWVEGEENTVLCITLEPEKGYYTYAPGQDGVYPTQISIKGGLQKIPLLFPLGTKKRDAAADKTVRVFDGTARVYALFPEKSEQIMEISLLACSQQHCVPFSVHENLSDVPSIDNASFQYKNELYDMLYAYSNRVLAAGQLGEIKNSSSPAPVRDEIGSTQENQQNDSSVQAAENGLEAFSLENLQKKMQAEIPFKQDAKAYSFQIQPFYRELEVRSAVQAVFFGLLAGFILNFMPCVLPIAALKVHAFLSADLRRDTGLFRRQMLFFALGILAWFMVLAMLLGLAGLTWGQVFQKYWLIFFLCVLVFMLALSLFDVFHLPVLNLRVREQKNAAADAFSGGFLATILATPCSGPLLGGVLGFTALQPFFVVLLVFLCMGLGMASPYFIFAYCPRLIRFMPKGGSWLIATEKALAFFLLGTALYLFSLLPGFLHMRTLIFLLILSGCLYVWGKLTRFCLQSVRKILAKTLLVICAAGSFAFLFIQQETENKTFFWQDFAKQEFMQSLGEKTLVLKFTADWCPTCKVLEKTVFSNKNKEELNRIFSDDVRFILVDMTRFSEEKQKLLTSLGSASIPLLAVFPKKTPYQPVIVRDIYTFGTVQKVLQKACSE